MTHTLTLSHTHPQLQLQHELCRHVIRLLGAGTRKRPGRGDARFLVLEFLELGTLADGIAAGVRQGHFETRLGRLVRGAKR
jgi:hypothetical protein